MNFFDAGTNTLITISLDSLIANDSDLDGDALSIVGVASGAGFTAVLDGLGNVVIDRDRALSDQIEVLYTLSDGSLGDIGSLFVNLIAANVAPEIQRHCTSP